MRIRAAAIALVIVGCAAPVSGARVRAGGKSATTSTDGRVTLSLSSRRPLIASATHSGYTAATKRLGVRR